LPLSLSLNVNLGTNFYSLGLTFTPRDKLFLLETNFNPWDKLLLLGTHCHLKRHTFTPRDKLSLLFIQSFSPFFQFLGQTCTSM
jgi:hypothetical protein